MLENQFIQVKHTWAAAQKQPAIVLPLDAGDAYCRVELFIIPDDGYNLTAVELVNENDEFLLGEQMQEIYAISFV